MQYWDIHTLKIMNTCTILHRQIHTHIPAYRHAWNDMRKFNMHLCRTHEHTCVLRYVPRVKTHTLKNTQMHILFVCRYMHEPAATQQHRYTHTHAYSIYNHALNVCWHACMTRHIPGLYLWGPSGTICIPQHLTQILPFTCITSTLIQTST